MRRAVAQHMDSGLTHIPPSPPHHVAIANPREILRLLHHEVYGGVVAWCLFRQKAPAMSEVGQRRVNLLVSPARTSVATMSTRSLEDPNHWHYSRRHIRSSRSELNCCWSLKVEYSVRDPR
jgi:hypothetical protein